MTKTDRLTQRGHELMQLGRLAKRLENGRRREDAAFVTAMLHASVGGWAVPAQMLDRLRALVEEVEGVQ